MYNNDTGEWEQRLLSSKEEQDKAIANAWHNYRLHNNSTTPSIRKDVLSVQDV